MATKKIDEFLYIEDIFLRGYCTKFQNIIHLVLFRFLRNICPSNKKSNCFRNISNANVIGIFYGEQIMHIFFYEYLFLFVEKKRKSKQKN